MCFSFKPPDIVWRDVFYSFFLAKPGGHVRCQYFPAVDKVLFVDDYAVGCRKDLNGILLLDTALQPPVAKPEDMVQLELPVTEVREEYVVIMFYCSVTPGSTLQRWLV